MRDDDAPLLPPNPNKGKSKTARIPVKVQPRANPLRKPRWIKATAPNRPEVLKVRELLRQHELNSVCEEAACPNLGECFSHGTATFMIMGKLCTRRCPFCDVAHGRPDPLDKNEPENLAKAIAAMQLKFVVITSVDRDDLRDGGAGHFVNCIEAVRQHSRMSLTTTWKRFRDCTGRHVPVPTTCTLYHYSKHSSSATRTPPPNQA